VIRSFCSMLSNKPLQRMWSPQGHRVESRGRLGGAHTAERQSVGQTRAGT